MSWKSKLERRELHRSRSLSASIALILTALALVAGALLVTLGPAGLLPSGVSADAVHETLVNAGGVSIAIGAALAIVGIVWLLLAITPGRRARRALQRDDVVIVVDDATLASALSGTAARAGRVSIDSAATILSSRRATVELAPGAGFDADLDAAQSSTAALVDRLQTKPGLRTTVKAGSR